MIVVAKTNPAAGAKGTSLLLVERGMPGFEKGKRLKKMGLKAQDTSELFFDDVRGAGRQPARRPPQENRGFICLMEQLPWERLQIAIGAVASAQAAIDWTLRLRQGAQGLRPAGGAASRTRASSWPRCRPRCRWRACSSTTALELLLEDKLDTATASMAKYWCSDLQCKVIDECVQLHRRLRLHVGVPDRPRLCRRARAAHLRRHQRDHEGSDQPLDGAGRRAE